jgi:hypothetical protein
MTMLATTGAVAAFVLSLAVFSATSRRRRAPSLVRDGVFRCRVGASVEDAAPPVWTTGPLTGRWVHDVLVLRGALGLRRRALWVRTAFGVIESNRRGANGERFVTIRLELEDGRPIHVTTGERAADALRGPFLSLHPAIRRTPPRV